MNNENEAARRARRQFKRAVRGITTPPFQGGAGIFQHGPTPAQRAVIEAARQARQANRLRQAARQGRNLPGGAPSLAGVAARAAVAGAAAAIGAGMVGQSPSQTGSGATQMAVTQLTNLETQAQLGRVQDDLGEIEGRLAHFPLVLDELRQRGYVHSGHLEDRLHLLDQQWDQLRPRVESNLAQQRQALEVDLQQARQRVRQMAQQPNATLSTSATGTLNNLSRQINDAEAALRQMYQGIQEELKEVQEATDQTIWMLDRLKEAPDIALRETEAPIAACEAQWRQQGDEGPKGILFITDQRLLFEQREEIATKKVLGLFDTETSKTQKLLLAIEVHDLESLEGEEEAGFLGMGKEEVLALVCGPKAPVTRAKFELEEWDSAELAALLQRVTSGAIDEDRADEYLAEVKQADAVVAQFPSQCPHCFAPVTAPPRGVNSLVCEYCGSTISAESSPA